MNQKQENEDELSFQTRKPNLLAAHIADVRRENVSPFKQAECEQYFEAPHADELFEFGFNEKLESGSSVLEEFESDELFTKFEEAPKHADLTGFENPKQFGFENPNQFGFENPSVASENSNQFGFEDPPVASGFENPQSGLDPFGFDDFVSQPPNNADFEPFQNNQSESNPQPMNDPFDFFGLDVQSKPEQKVKSPEVKPLGAVKTIELPPIDFDAFDDYATFSEPFPEPEKPKKKKKKKKKKKRKSFEKSNESDQVKSGSEKSDRNIEDRWKNEEATIPGGAIGRYDDPNNPRPRHRDVMRRESRRRYGDDNLGPIYRGRKNYDIKIPSKSKVKKMAMAGAATACAAAVAPGVVGAAMIAAGLTLHREEKEKKKKKKREQELEKRKRGF